MLVVFSMAILLMIGCNSEPTNIEETTLTDAQLIEQIKTATNKQNITVAELPTTSQDVLVQDYSESTVEQTKKAPELGYELDLIRNRGSRMGERSNSYFNLDGRELQDERSGDERSGRDREECFEFVYPMTLIMPDSSTITGNSEEELWTAVRSWYAVNPGVLDEPAIQYPVDIILRDSTLTINSDEELRRIYALCGGGSEPEDCYEFVYPITYIMPDGSTVTGNSGEEVGIAIRNWYTANPGVTGDPVLQYPVDIIFDDGTTVTVNSDEELRQAIATYCGGGRP
jgi:hypothetical protein